LGYVIKKRGVGTFVTKSPNLVNPLYLSYNVIDRISTGGFEPNHHTGLEAGFQGEVGVAATRSGITREKANEIALKLLEKYQDTFDTPKRGKPFQEAYDLKSITPIQEWQDCYRRVKGELTKLGLEFTQGPWD
jgi:hypothetical protein